MTDASTGGYGICETKLGSEAAEQVERGDERWRFQWDYEQAEGPRATALRAADPFKDVNTVNPLRPARQVDLETRREVFPWYLRAF